jgi:hypothetical protein
VLNFDSGFTVEGIKRQVCWQEGAFRDEVIVYVVSSSSIEIISRQGVDRNSEQRDPREGLFQAAPSIRSSNVRKRRSGDQK